MIACEATHSLLPSSTSLGLLSTINLCPLLFQAVVPMCSPSSFNSCFYLIYVISLFYVFTFLHLPPPPPSPPPSLLLSFYPSSPPSFLPLPLFPPSFSFFVLVFPSSPSLFLIPLPPSLPSSFSITTPVLRLFIIIHSPSPGVTIIGQILCSPASIQCICHISRSLGTQGECHVVVAEGTEWFIKSHLLLLGSHLCIWTSLSVT